MATTTSSRTGTGTTPTPPAPTPEPERDYVNPGVFVRSGQPLLVVEDRRLIGRVEELKHTDVPWDLLATLKIYDPRVCDELVIAGWPGVYDMVQLVEQAVVRRVQDQGR